LKVSPNTLRREFSTLHNLFEVAKEEWGIRLHSNPLSAIKLGGPKPHRERRLNGTEEADLLRAALAARNRLIRPIIALAIETALRRGELLALRWTDVRLPERCLTVADSKNGFTRTIPLTRHALEVLGKLPRITSMVFPVSPNALRLAWERIRRRAGCPDLHFHDLRHEAISRFFEMGLTTPEVASISGHRDIRMLMRYAHPMRQSIIEQMDKGDTERGRK
jgi:integrase